MTDEVLFHHGTTLFAELNLLQLPCGGWAALASSSQPTLEPTLFRGAGAGLISWRRSGSSHVINSLQNETEVPLAVVRIVPCKVSAESGPIEVGDLLVTSSTPGHTMKGVDRSKRVGSVVGKSLERLEQGTGVIRVLATLQ